MTGAGPASVPSASATEPLWRLLLGVASQLATLEAASPAAAPGAPAHPGVQALTYQVLRGLGRARALRRRLAPRAPPPAADALLTAALALASDASAPYEAFTLVDQAVEAAKRQRSLRAQAGFINACLRRFLRERDALLAALAADPAVRWNHPPWWIERLRHDHPAHWQQILAQGQARAPMVLRVNRRRIGRDAWLAGLRAGGIDAAPIGADGVLLARPCNVGELPGFADGQVSVQDSAAQHAAPLLLAGLDASPGSTRRPRVLDACAAPGGKTAHLLERADLDLVALDIDAARCRRIAENLERLGLAGPSVRVLAADAAQPRLWPAEADAGAGFDAILLDAPCTASGIVRRHPDVPWRRRESDIARLAATQAALLDALWPLLRGGGRLLYATCSVFRDEGETGVQAFVARNKQAHMLPAPGHLLPQTGAWSDALPENGIDDHDGFFYALLEKRAS